MKDRFIIGEGCYSLSEFSKAQKGKHSKPHKPHKPHNYDPQMIEDAKSMKCNEWRRKWGKSDTLYRKLKA